MCIISILPKGTEKNTQKVIDFISNGFRNNGDGSGFMYKKEDTKTVYLNKGYFLLDSLLKDIKDANLGIQDELVVHHRIGNVGLVNIANCHPFVCSNNENEISKIKGKVNKPCLVHNGTMYDIVNYRNLNLDFSDTYAFSRYIVGDPYMMGLLKTNLPLFDKLLKTIINNSKLCFLFPDRDLLKTDNFLSDDGYFHSNDGYKNNWYRDIGGILKEKKEDIKSTYNISNNRNLSFTDKIDNFLIGGYKHKIDKILSKVILVFGGDFIRITEFNYNFFTYNYKDKRHIEYDTDFMFNQFKNNKSNVLTNKWKHNGIDVNYLVNEHDLHVHCEFIVNSEYTHDFRDYLILMRDLEPSKKLMKKLYKQLYNTRYKSLDYKIKFERLHCYFTKLALIEYFNYFKDDFLSDPTELDIKSIHNPDFVLIKDYKQNDLPIVTNNNKFITNEQLNKMSVPVDLENPELELADLIS